jgi:methylthioribose-1-phosphate isomerase
MPIHDTLRAVQWSEDCLLLLDQRRLPAVTEYLEINNVREVAQAIADMVVRGAPAIGITAAYGVVLAARARYEASSGDWQQSIQPDLKLLAASRPTAVNLFWALQRMREAIEKIDTDPFLPLLTEAQRIHQEDIAANHRMGELGASLLDGKSVLTHCNAGALATGGYGTALGVVRSGVTAKCIGTVYADETRPWMQGSRLTAWELMQDSIPVTLVCEGASASLLRTGEVSWVIVGADRVAANGDVANKIGTYSLAVNARQHGVRFMVVAPTSTIDMATQCGDDIHIEVRSAQEILTLAGLHLAAQGAQAWNPVFDVTPAEFVTALVTERGIIHHPNRHKLEALMRN